MDFVIQVLVGMVVMAIIDVPVIVKVIGPTLERTAKGFLAKKPDLVAAFIFYVGYVSFVVYFSQIGTETTGEVAVRGALLGLFAYGTYEFTNKAVLSKWSWRMVAIDTTWGVILTSAIATLTHIITQ